MNLQQLNKLTEIELAQELEKCCGSNAWINAMVAKRPFASIEALHAQSDEIWNKLDESAFLEAFSHHPQIGDIESLKKKFANTAQWAGSEQQGTQLASDEILAELKNGNDKYLKQFGFIFIVRATGKTAQQMLSLLNERLSNDRQTELLIAAAEQNKITHLRLNKLLQETTMSPKMATITTHVLDTAKGCPAANIAVTLEYLNNNNWQPIAKGITNNDGRIIDWMQDSSTKTGQYRITFDTDSYHQGQGFFPSVTINFNVKDPNMHYHVPLLLSPFSFSTYRGS